MTLALDGAPHLAKVAASMLSEQMPDYINDTYWPCALFNLTGGSNGCTRAVDWDNCGKRMHERIKGKKGLKIGSYTFEKTSIALYGTCAGIFQSENHAEIVLNPRDNMDVYEMIEGNRAVAMFARVPFSEYPVAFCSDIANLAVFRELRLLGNIIHCMVILIIRHDGAFKSNDHMNHFSVSQLLVTGCTLTHLLFTVYQMNKSNFCSTKLRNWQDSIKSMFCLVIMHRYHKVNDYYWFLDSSSG